MADRKKPIKKQNNVLSFENFDGLRLNIGLLIAGVILVYILVVVIIFLNSNHIERHEVREGSLAVNNTYTGIAIREEQVVLNTSAGYTNFYIYDGERTAVGDLVYTVDETGRLETSVGASFEESKLSDKELREFRSEIINYMHTFDDKNYETVYDFKHSLSNTVAKLTNANLLRDIENLNSADVINYCYAPTTGIVSYWTDGYEDKKPEDLTAADFEKKNYDKKQVIADNMIEIGFPVYKICTSELWDIVIPIDSERGAQLEEEGYVKVRFQKNQMESWASTKMFYGDDGNSFLKLSFNNSMVTFAGDRFLDIELIVEEETGLKIPLTAIVEKEFFLLEEPFLIDEGQKGKRAVIRQCYLEDGTISTEKIIVDIYSYDEEKQKYFVDASVLNTGDILHKLDDQGTDVVRERATLIGVYNINKGYADFKEINILYQNEEYAIVESNTEYGLKVYDYIVLNADSVQSEQFINQ